MKKKQNLENYLLLYKDKTIDQEPLNEADYLLCSLLSYINIPNLDKEVSFDEFIDKFVYQIEGVEKYGRVVTKVKDIACSIRNVPRYRNLVVKDYIYDVNNETQFGAMIFDFGDKAVLSFTGSDGSIIGWFENIRCSYQFPTYTQNKAKEYLKSNIQKYKKLVLTGHSKGGNMAVVSAMDLPQDELDKIEEIYNFDGQGFFKEIVESAVYKRIENKVINYIPESSYIGILMRHGGRTNIIKTLVHGISLHFQFNWQIEGTSIALGKKHTFKSRKLHLLITKRWDRLDKNDLERVFERAINAMEVDRTSKVKITPIDIIRAIKINNDKKLIRSKHLKILLKAMLLTDKIYK